MERGWTQLNNSPLNTAVDILVFITKVTNYPDLHAPAKKIQIPAKYIRREPWMTKGITEIY